jgi:hypothetical protein
VEPEGAAEAAVAPEDDAAVEPSPAEEPEAAEPAVYAAETEAAAQNAANVVPDVVEPEVATEPPATDSGEQAVETASHDRANPGAVGHGFADDATIEFEAITVDPSVEPPATLHVADGAGDAVTGLGAEQVDGQISIEDELDAQDFEDEMDGRRTAERRA